MRKVGKYMHYDVPEKIIRRAMEASNGRWKLEFVGEDGFGMWIIQFDDPKLGRAPETGRSPTWQYTWPTPQESRQILQQLESRGLVGVPQSTERCVIAVDRCDRAPGG